MLNLPEFSSIEPKQIKSTLRAKLNAFRELIQQLLEQPEYTWDNFVHPLIDRQVALDNYWAAVSHLHAYASTEVHRSVYQACLPIMTAFTTELGTNQALYQAYRRVKEAKRFTLLTPAQKSVINNAIRDFELAGVNLQGQASAEYQDNEVKLSELCNQFQQNVMDATQAWSKLIDDESLLAGVPERIKSSLKHAAQQKQLEGWLLSLDMPTFFTIVTYAENRELRQEIYTAFFTRASDQSPTPKNYDNSPIMHQILECRDKKAKLLGFNHYVEYSLATKMASSTEEVMQFLTDLADKVKPIAVKDWNMLADFAATHLQLTVLEGWDLAYVKEKCRQHQWQTSLEALRSYFEINQVIKGLFAIAAKLYQVTIIEREQTYDKYHNDVTFYEVYSEQGELIAGFYLDLYARPNKRAGAWMENCCSRHRYSGGELQLPIAFLVCNFSQPVDNHPALLSHDDVRTLFHEFGHGLHHMLTQVDIANVAGLNGVAWDAVEFPSQFMENWCWQPSSLQLVAQHFQDKSPLTDTLFESLLASKHYQVAIDLMRQLELAIFDLRIHAEFSGEDNSLAVLAQIRATTSVVPVPEFHRVQNSFLHIFSGGYAAGLYSYEWAKVLSCDAFSRFKQEGIFNLALSTQFKKAFLESGGVQNMSECFLQYMGRAPCSEALLEEISGLARIEDFVDI